MKDELVTFFIFINYSSTGFTYLCLSSADSRMYCLQIACHILFLVISTQKYWYCEGKDKPTASPRKRRKYSLRRVYRLWTQTELRYRVCFYCIYSCKSRMHWRALGKSPSVGVMGGERFAFVGFASKMLCQPLKNLLKARFCLFILTTVFAQSTLTNAMNLIYFNAVREFAHNIPFPGCQKKKYTVAANITQWKGDQFLMVWFHNMNVCWVIKVTLKF